MNVLWKPIAAAVILGAMVAGPVVYGAITELLRVQPGVWQAMESKGIVDIVVVLDFKPESFHIKFLQDEGVVSHVSGNTVQVRRVEQRALSRIARQYWILRIELLKTSGA